jgi:hypothetical protein
MKNAAMTDGQFLSAHDPNFKDGFGGRVLYVAHLYDFSHENVRNAIEAEAGKYPYSSANVMHLADEAAKDHTGRLASIICPFLARTAHDAKGRDYAIKTLRRFVNLLRGNDNAWRAVKAFLAAPPYGVSTE